jgi:hypothetical protein
MRRTRLLRLGIALAAVCATALVLTGTSSGTNVEFCGRGGTLAAGGHPTVIVAQGLCTAQPGGLVAIGGQLIVEPGGAFNGDVAAGIEIRGSIIVYPTGVVSISNAEIGGSVVADRPNSVIFHGDLIGGDVTITGGGGGPTGSCERSDVPVSFVPYNAVEDSDVGGSIAVSGYRGCWQGFFRNSIGENVTLLNNTVEDPDGNELANNTIGNNLRCFGNAPAPQFGDSGGGPNTVGGVVQGRQCLGVVA